MTKLKKTTISKYRGKNNVNAGKINLFADHNTSPANSMWQNSFQGCLERVRYTTIERNVPETAALRITVPKGSLKKLRRSKSVVSKMLKLIKKEFGFNFEQTETKCSFIFTIKFGEEVPHRHKLLAVSFIRYLFLSRYSNVAECILYLYHTKGYDIVTAIQLASLLVDPMPSKYADVNTNFNMGPIGGLFTSFIRSVGGFPKLSKKEFLENAENNLYNSLKTSKKGFNAPTLLNSGLVPGIEQNAGLFERQLQLHRAMKPVEKEMKRDLKSGTENPILKQYIPHIYEK